MSKEPTASPRDDRAAKARSRISARAVSAEPSGSRYASIRDLHRLLTPSRRNDCDLPDALPPRGQAASLSLPSRPLPLSLGTMAVS